MTRRLVRLPTLCATCGFSLLLLGVPVRAQGKPEPSPLAEMREAALSAADLDPEQPGRSLVGAGIPRREAVRALAAEELVREVEARREVPKVAKGVPPGQGRQGGPPAGQGAAEEARGAGAKAQEAKRGQDVIRAREKEREREQKENKGKATS